MDKVQILTDEKGKPAYAVVPWKDFERMKASGDEDQRMIALIQYQAGVMMIRFFGSHEEYDEVNAETV